MHQQRLGVCRLDVPQNGAQRLLGLLRLEATQAVITAKLNQHPARLMLLEQRRQARQTLLRGIAADAAVDNGRLALPFVIEQSRRAALAAMR